MFWLNVLPVTKTVQNLRNLSLIGFSPFKLTHVKNAVPVLKNQVRLLMVNEKLFVRLL